MLPYVVTIFLGAFLLFQVQPLIGKFILPWFGGSPAVWTTCMLFFQMLLLGGYAYAHVSGRLTTKTRAWVHLALLAASLALLPIIPSSSLWKPIGSDYPTWHILLLLTAVVGAPYFLLSTTSPLLQDWFARTHPGRSPYRLYALSNLGSLLALVSYPFLVEPHMALRAQAMSWSIAYAAFVAACAWCAFGVMRRADAAVLPESLAPLPENPDIPPVPACVPAQEERPRATVIILWLLLAACGSLVLLATTNQLCQEVAVVPFLWVVPLALYLLTFVIAFDNPRWYVRHALTFIVLFACVGWAIYVMFQGTSIEVPKPMMHLFSNLPRPAYEFLTNVVFFQIVVYSLALFACCMVCHGELARLKPAPRHLTLFYLMVAAGGALGGLFVVVVATHFFTGYWEYHVALVGTCLLALVAYLRDPGLKRTRPKPAWAWAILFILSAGIVVASFYFIKSRPYYCVLAAVGLIAHVFHLFDRKSAEFTGRPFWAGGILLAGFAVVIGSLAWVCKDMAEDSLERTRNFYGVLKVREIEDWQFPGRMKRTLINGRIDHGFQFVDNELRGLSTSYYGPDSGIGIAIRYNPRRMTTTEADNTLCIGVVGLGTGTIASYGKKGDTIRFYDINPEVIRLSAKYFTYTRDTPARVTIVVGDARIQMERELARGEPQLFDVLAVDAFTSDAIPMHLLTRECAEIYFRHLKPDGILAVHVSNRYLELEPVVRGIAKALGREAVRVECGGDPYYGVSTSDWVLVTTNRAFLESPELIRAKTPWSKESAAPLLWTDDYGSLFQVLKKKE